MPPLRFHPRPFWYYELDYNAFHATELRGISAIKMWHLLSSICAHAALTCMNISYKNLTHRAKRFFQFDALNRYEKVSSINFQQPFSRSQMLGQKIIMKCFFLLKHHFAGQHPTTSQMSLVSKPVVNTQSTRSCILFHSLFAENR